MLISRRALCELLFARSGVPANYETDFIKLDRLTSGITSDALNVKFKILA